MFTYIVMVIWYCLLITQSVLGFYMPSENSAEHFHPIDARILDKNSDLVFNIWSPLKMMM